MPTAITSITIQVITTTARSPLRAHLPLTVDVITGGEQDYSDADGVATDTLVPATSNLSVAGNNIQIVLDTGDDDIGDDGIETLRGSVVSANRALISEFDDVATGTGSVDAQDSDDSQEQPDGSYAFVVSGHSAAGNQLAIGGVLSFDDGDLSAGDSIFDINELTVGTGAGPDVRLGLGIRTGRSSVASPSLCSPVLHPTFRPSP